MYRELFQKPERHHMMYGNDMASFPFNPTCLRMVSNYWCQSPEINMGRREELLKTGILYTTSIY